MSYYYQLNGEKYGPLPLEDLVRIISLDDFVCVSDSEEWIKARDIPEVFAKFNEHNAPKKVTPPPLPTTPQVSKVPPPIPKATVNPVESTFQAPPPARSYVEPKQKSDINNQSIKPKKKSFLVPAIVIVLLFIVIIMFFGRSSSSSNNTSNDVERQEIKGEGEKSNSTTNVEDSYIICPHCQGTKIDYIDCDCQYDKYGDEKPSGGYRKEQEVHNIPMYDIPVKSEVLKTCYKCNGSGKFKITCEVCSGLGRVKEHESKPEKQIERKGL